MPETKQKIYQQIHNALMHSQNILLATHLRPDGDALGSILAFYRFLIQQNKKVKMFIHDEHSADFNFLPYFNKIEHNLTALLNHKFDTLAILDCGDFSRSGLESFLPSISFRPQIINIDHHISNDNFGQHNLVDLDASSTSEIIFNLFKTLNLEIDEKIATSLLTGILTDTDFFVNPNTTHQTLKITADLINQGARLNLILKQVYKKDSIKSLKLCGKALSRLNIDAETKLATTAIFQDDLEEVGASEDELVGLSSCLNSLTNVKGTLVLKEHNTNLVKGSLRTTQDDVDVSEIAEKYGGGGHKKAAGFKVRGRIVKDENGGWRIERNN